MKRVFIDLYNQEQSVHFSGEAIPSDDKVTKYTLDGQGRIEHKNHVKNRGIFTGKFVQNIRSGYATKTTLDSDGKVLWQYEGVYADDYPHGQGNLTIHETVKEIQPVNDGDSSFRTDKDDTYGEAKVVDADIQKQLQGNFVKGVFEGFGRLNIDGVITYSGQWLGGKPHGHGQCVYESEKATYTGMWENGLWSGEGTLVTENGYLIRNQFKEGKLNGEGARNFKSGKTLTGKWIDNELVIGKCVNADGTIYEGEWLGGRPHGHGTKTIQGGKRYEGQFSLGRPWGQGAKVDKSESRDEGYWDQAKFIKGKAPESKEQEFSKELRKVKTYYDIYERFHSKDLPKTNYDIFKEQETDLKMKEKILLEHLTKEYASRITLAAPLPQEFRIESYELIDKATLEKANSMVLDDPSKLMSSAGFTRENFAPRGEIDDQPPQIIEQKDQEEEDSHVINMKQDASKEESPNVTKVEEKMDKHTIQHDKDDIPRSVSQPKLTNDQLGADVNDYKDVDAKKQESDTQTPKVPGSAPLTSDNLPVTKSVDVREDQSAASSSAKVPLKGIRFEDESESNTIYTETDLQSKGVGRTPSRADSAALGQNKRDDAISQILEEDQVSNEETQPVVIDQTEDVDIARLDTGTRQETTLDHQKAESIRVEVEEEKPRLSPIKVQPAPSAEPKQAEETPEREPQRELDSPRSPAQYDSIKQINLANSDQKNPEVGVFNFQIIEKETNQETMQRVLDFIEQWPNQIEKLPDGSLYMGPKINGQPCGCGFVVIFANSEQTQIEQTYLGHFINGQASNFGYLIFDKGLGRYTGEWQEGKYHGKGLFKRTVIDQHKETGAQRVRSMVYDGQWQKGDMSGFGMFQWPSGNVYEGEWLANRRHGLGKVTDKTGKVRQAGTWQMGSYVNQA